MRTNDNDVVVGGTFLGDPDRSRDLWAHSVPAATESTDLVLVSVVRVLLQPTISIGGGVRRPGSARASSGATASSYGRCELRPVGDLVASSRALAVSREELAILTTL